MERETIGSATSPPQSSPRVDDQIQTPILFTDRAIRSDSILDRLAIGGIKGFVLAIEIVDLFGYIEQLKTVPPSATIAEEYIRATRERGRALAERLEALLQMDRGRLERLLSRGIISAARRLRGRLSIASAYEKEGELGHASVWAEFWDQFFIPMDTLASSVDLAEALGVEVSPRARKAWEGLTAKARRDLPIIYRGFAQADDYLPTVPGSVPEHFFWHYLKPADPAAAR